MTVLLSLMAAILSVGIFYLTDLYTVWYWYFLPVLMFIPLYWISFLALVLVAAFIGLFVSKKKPVEKPNAFFYTVTVAAIRQVMRFLRIKVRAISNICFGGDLRVNKQKGLDKFIAKLILKEIKNNNIAEDMNEEMSIPAVLPENISRFADEIRHSF